MPEGAQFELDPELSAVRVLSRGQAVVLAVAAATVAGLLAAATSATVVGLFTACCGAGLLGAGYQARLAAATWSGRAPPIVAPPLDDDELPRYTLLIPLYQEAAVVAGLVSALTALDYPPELLDVKLLVEIYDLETIRALAELELGPQFEVVRLPPGQPRTKPRACNIGLMHARGELVVIFDAEDRPEPDQLRKAAALLRAASPDVVCVQARLGFWNRTTSFTTRYSAAEFCATCEVLRPGLERLEIPMPLGGTSNHFPVQVLRELGAWDQFNVAEDADLGIRLSRRGYRTRLLDSTTYEEATSRMPNWVRQRSRWIKGWIQTWLVHTRHPVRLHRELGTRRAVHFHLTMLGTLVPVMLGPVAWTLPVLSLLELSGLVTGVLPGWLLALGTGSVLTSIGVQLLATNTGLRRTHHARGSVAILLVPTYELLKTIAAGKALWQLVTRPHYWEKTTHGLEPERPPVRTDPLAAESPA